MSKRLDRAISVAPDQRGRPRHFGWGRRQIAVKEILDEWEEAGCWWQGEEARRVYRVRGADGAAYELHHQPPNDWRLYRTYD